MAELEHLVGALKYLEDADAEADEDAADTLAMVSEASAADKAAWPSWSIW